mgnify:CR=1 FL=1
MADDKKISQLAPLPSVVGTEEVALARGNSNYKFTFDEFKAWIEGNRNMDGGSASAVFTAEQVVNGGGA